MANKKFSEFELKTTTSNVSHIVGYNGAENVRITPANFLDTTGGPYLPLAGGIMVGNTIHNDNVKSIYGTSGDGLEIYHDSLNSVIRDSGTGNLVIAADDFRLQVSDQTANMITANTGAEVNLMYNGGIKLATTNTGITVVGNANFNDNGRAIFGSPGNDLELFHDGLNSYIQDSGTGVLFVTTNSFNLKNSLANENMISATENGAVNLYYNNVKKFETTSTGISVTGGIKLSDNQYLSWIGSNTRMIGQSGYLRFQVGGTDKMSLDSSGNLGLGTSSPSLKIEINQTNNNIYQFALHNTHLGTTAKTRVGNWDNDVKLSSNFMQSGGTKTQDDATLSSWVLAMGSGSDYFAITRSPVGSTTLSTLLQLDGAGVLQIGPTANYTTISQGSFFSKGGGNMFTGNVLAGAAITRVFKMQRNDVEKYNIGLGASDELAFINPSAVSTMSITSAGVLTVGSPSSTRLVTTITENDKVDLKAIDGTDSSRNLTFSTGNSERMRISSAGNVGIGITTFNNFATAKQLLVKGDASNTNSIIQSISNDSGSSLAMYSGASTTDNPLLVFQNDLRFGSATNAGLSNFSEKMRITSGGAISLANANTSVIGRPYSSGTIANGQSVVINLNSAGGNQSTGFIAISAVPPFSNTGGAVGLFTQIHTQGANLYTQLMLVNENGITISESGGSFTVSNSSGSTINYNVKVLNLTDLASTIAGV